MLCLYVIRNNCNSPHFAEQKIMNASAVFRDADHGGEQCTHIFLSGVLITFVGIVVDYKMERQGCMSLSSTNSEIQVTFSGTKKAI